MSIRTINQTLNRRLGIGSTTPRVKVRGGRLLQKAKSKKRLIRYGILAVNVLVLGIAAVFVIKTPDTSGNAKQSSLNGPSANSPTSPLDELSSADIAAQVAQLTKLPEATAVTNQADSANALLTVSATDDKVISKPQVVNTTAKSKKDIVRYVTVAGDNVASLASKFGVTSDSIRWSNGLTGDALTAGRELWISPVSDGIVYVVKAGDTAQSLADKYRSNKDAIISFNDAEVGGLVLGDRIIIPGGTQPAARGGTGTSSLNFSWFGASAVYSANGYDFGWCTYYAAVRRAQIGRPIPSNLGNANTWYSRAVALGMPAGNVPAVGAVMVEYVGAYPRNHVGVVEQVNEDGSYVISEMNYSGWNVKTSRTISDNNSNKFIY